MEEDQGRASPPLPSKGAYNIDFDTLDDSFNPFETKKGIRNSPPLPRKELGNTVESTQETSAVGGDQIQVGSGSPKEIREVPKKKKLKSHSSKRASAVIEGDGNEGTPDSSAGGDGPDASDVTAASAADKPVKPRKVVKKPKSRPVSKNLEQKVEGQGTPERTHIPEDTALAPTEDNDTKPLPNTCASTSTPQDNSIPEDSAVKPHPEKPPARNQDQIENSQSLPEESMSQADKTTSQLDRSSPQSDKTLSRTDKLEPQRVKSPQEETVSEKSQTAPETTPELTEKTSRQTEKLPLPTVGEDGVESPPKKERSGKVKKTKTKVKKRSASPRLSTSEGDVDGVDASSRLADDHISTAEKDRESKSSLRVSSQGDAVIPHDSSADSDVVKSKHPAARVLEQQVRDDHSQPLPRGDSDMADSHSTESVVKLVQVMKYSQTDWNKLRQELELNFQAQLLAKEREWGAKLADRDARLTTLEDTNKKLRQTNEDMRTVMGEFEKTIGQLQSEKEKTSNASQQSLQDVVKERDQALEDLQSVETAFSDLHRRYEKTKGVVDGFKQNEEVLKKCVQDLQNKLKKTEQKVQVVKEQAEEKLERATEEIEKTQKSSASEIARLEAALRKAELQVHSMESTLEQKVKENKELAAICDELIAKVQ